MDEASLRHAPNGFAYWSTKTYNHSVGISCAFRQWRARSHCRFLHGYALEVKFGFMARSLDSTNWVVDFGSMKSLKGWLEDMLDHKTLVASNDPLLGTFKDMHAKGIIDMIEVEATGCEAMARWIFEYAELWLQGNYPEERVTLDFVEVKEHPGNSAIFGRTFTARMGLDPSKGQLIADDSSKGIKA